MVTPQQINDAARVLGIAADSDRATVRCAFRTAAKRHHPDAGGDKATFRQVREAYEVLLQVAPATAAAGASRASTQVATGAPVRVVNAYAWAGAPATTVGRWVDVAA